MQNEKKYTIFDFEKMSMQSTQGRAKLRFGIYRNNPRVTVYTNDDNDKGNNFGMITAALDPTVFMTLLDTIMNLTTSANGTKFKIDNMTLTDKDPSTGKREMRHVNSLMVGKDDEGVMWISVVEANRPKFKFEFGRFPFHKFYGQDGKEMSKAELSVMAAKATVNLMRNIFATYVTTNYEHTPAGQFKGKGGGSNRPAPAAIANDDLPY